MATRHHPHPHRPATRPHTDRPTTYTPHTHTPASDSAEPHPWGAPLPIGHPGYRPPRHAVTTAFVRWVTYIAVLAVAFAIAAVALLVVTEPEPSGVVEIRSEAVEAGR